MPEFFSKFRGKRRNDNLAERSLDEYRNAPIDSQGRPQTDLIRAYQTERAERPITKNDLEKRITLFIEGNLQFLGPILVEVASEYGPSSEVRLRLSDILIRKFGLTSEYLAQMGTGLQIKDYEGDAPAGKKGRSEIVSSNGGRYSEVDETSMVNQLALACAQELIAVHTSRSSKTDFPHRYYFKPLNRYLCENDFGMRNWDDQENRLDDGDVTSASEIVKQIREIIQNIVDNLKAIKAEIDYRGGVGDKYITDQDRAKLAQLESQLETAKHPTREDVQKLQDLKDELEESKRQYSDTTAINATRQTYQDLKRRVEEYERNGWSASRFGRFGRQPIPLEEQQALKDELQRAKLAYDETRAPYEAAQERQRQLSSEIYSLENRERELTWEIQSFQEDLVKKGTSMEALQILTKNPAARKIIFQAIPPSRAMSRAWNHRDRIAKELGYVSRDAIEDYEQFKQEGVRDVGGLIRIDTSRDLKDLPFQVCWLEQYDRPVIISKNFQPNKWVETAQGTVREYLAQRAIESQPDLAESVRQYRCSRGPNSPYFYSDDLVYDFVIEVGPEKARAILATDDRQISEQLAGYNILRKMGYDLREKDADWIKRQLNEEHNLATAGVWQYLEQREGARIQQRRIMLGDGAKYADWREVIGDRTSRALFQQGKQMYWLAKQVWLSRQDRAPEDRFYHVHYQVPWKRYDTQGSNITTETIRKHLNQSGKFIIALLGLELDQDRRQYDQSQDDSWDGVNLATIIQVLESGKEIKGVALARDRKRYLQALMSSDTNGNDLELALADWPDELLGAVSEQEVNLYYKYASDYVLSDQQGLAGYAKQKLTWGGGVPGFMALRATDQRRFGFSFVY